MLGRESGTAPLFPPVGVVAVIVLSLLGAACAGDSEIPRGEGAAATPSSTNGPRKARPSGEAGPASGREDPRITALRHAVEARPEDPEAHHTLARALNESGGKPESIPHFERAAELDPSVRNLFDLAVAYTGLSRLPDAEATYRRLLAIAPEEQQALHNLGNVFLGMGRKEEAIDTLWRAIRARPDLLLAQYDLANIYKFYGQHQEAYSMYQSVRRSTPRNEREQEAAVDSLYQIAAIDVARGAHAQAEKALARLLQRMPEHSSAHYMRGQALLHLGRQEEARREFDIHVQILERQPANSPMATTR